MKTKTIAVTIGIRTIQRNLVIDEMQQNTEGRYLGKLLNFDKSL